MNVLQVLGNGSVSVDEESFSPGVETEAAPASDVETEKSPASDVETEKSPASDVKTEKSPASDAETDKSLSCKAKNGENKASDELAHKIAKGVKEFKKTPGGKSEKVDILL